MTTCKGGVGCTLQDHWHQMNIHVQLSSIKFIVSVNTYLLTGNPSTKKMGSDDSKFSFPWILEVFKLHPYDFYKVLESFTKAEPVLTKDIIISG
jgi:hypothetical protein